VLVTGSTGSTEGAGLPIWIGGVIFEVSPDALTCPGNPEARDQLPLYLGALRHDLRNWLSEIVGYWEALQERLPEDESLQLYAARIGQGIDGISNVVNHIDEKPDAGKRMPEWQHLTKEFRAAAAGILPEPIRLELSDDLPEIFADPFLPSVCTNLLDNAVRHGGKVTTVSVSVRTEGDAAVVTVEDDGAGIPPAFKERIFEPGYGRHTGYGLYFTRAILGRTGLTICECGEEGCGARFEIRVPHGFFRAIKSETGKGPHPAGHGAP
jgi:signal transduction histidine kinase